MPDVIDQEKLVTGVPVGIPESAVERSEEVQDIMEKVPSWITRWGIFLMAVLFIGLLIGSIAFRYPDVIPAQVMISSSSPPVKVIAPVSAPIQRFFVTDHSQVSQGEILCLLNNTGNYEDILLIKQLAAQIDTARDIRQVAANFYLPSVINAGELQGDYISLLQSLISYRFFLGHNEYGVNIRHMTDQSLVQHQLSEQLRRNGLRSAQQLAIQQHRFELDSSLVAKTVLSVAEYEAAKKELLSQQSNADAGNINVLQSRLQQKEIQRSMSETLMRQQAEENNYIQKVHDAARSFNGNFSKWEKNYLLRAPVSGNVTFYKYWKEQQFVQAGEPVMLITPPIRQYMARGSIGVLGAGKVKAGQKVLVRLPAYPYQEYGSLNGTLKSRSSVALDTTFAIEITLQNGLCTNTGKTIPPQAQLLGTAEITTENRSLFQRLFENIYGKYRR